MSVAKKKGRIILAVALSAAITVAAILSVVLRRERVTPVAEQLVPPTQQSVQAAYQSVTIRSTNRLPNIARPGDTVSLSFVVTGTEAVTPTAEISGRSATVRQTGDYYIAELMLDGEAEEGNIPFSIELHDAKGTPLARTDFTTDGSSVIHDRTIPALKEVAFESDNLNNPQIAATGSRITLTIWTSEPLENPPEIWIAGNLAEHVEQIDPTRFRAEMELTDELVSGPVPYRIEYTDLAGNHGPTVSQMNGPVQLFFDSSVPIIRSVSIASTNPQSTSLALPGDTVVLTFGVSEGLSEQPVVRIAGIRASDVRQIGPKMYEARIISPANPSENSGGYSIYIEDEAGNAASVVDRTTDGSSITYRTGRTDTTWVEPVEIAKVTAPAVQDKMDDGSIMGIDIEFQVSIVRTTPREEEVKHVAVAPVQPEHPQVTINQAPEPTTEQASEEPSTEAMESSSEEVAEIAVQSEATKEVQSSVEAVGPESYVIIDSPTSESLYGSHIEIAGRVYEPEKAVSIAYEVSPLVFLGQRSAFLAGYAEILEDGSFAFILSTEELLGSQQVSIIIRYEDGRLEEAELALHEGDSDIPSFAVQAQGESALLSWDRHPLAETYSVSFGNASPGSDGKREMIGSITSPSRISGLVIGEAYQFELIGYGEDDDFVGNSSQIEMIALTEDTLTPSVDGEYKRIRVRWPEIAATTNFILLIKHLSHLP